MYLWGDQPVIYLLRTEYIRRLDPGNRFMNKLWDKYYKSFELLNLFKAQKQKSPEINLGFLNIQMAGAMGLEPTTFAVTGRHCNQLNYAPASIEWMKI